MAARVMCSFDGLDCVRPSECKGEGRCTFYTLSETARPIIVRTKQAQQKMAADGIRRGLEEKERGRKRKT